MTLEPMNEAEVITSSSGNVANAQALATLPAESGKRTWITGFQITASGATAGLVVNATVANLIGGTLTYSFAFPAGVLVGAPPLVVNFSHPIPASADNTTIIVSLPAGGSGAAHASVCATGFVQ